MTIYSQTQIEGYLDFIFPTDPGANGLRWFMEIGAWDGELISNSAYLERERGWNGICIEPFPVNFEKRKCLLCSKAISATGGVREFMKVSTDRRDNGIVSYFSGFTSAVNVHLPLIEEHCNHAYTQVETITIEELYQEYHLPRYIDFLSIDTEGAELEIIQSIPFYKFSYGMIIYEHNEIIKIKQKVGSILKANGYALFKSLRCDDIWINKELQV